MGACGGVGCSFRRMLIVGVVPGQLNRKLIRKRALPFSASGFGCEADSGGPKPIRRSRTKKVSPKSELWALFSGARCKIDRVRAELNGIGQSRENVGHVRSESWDLARVRPNLPPVFGAMST